MNTKPDPIDIHVGLRVRMKRIAMNMTQTELAEAIGISFQQVQKYEHGANRIGSSRLFEIAQALNVSISYFFEDMPSDKLNKVVPVELSEEERLNLERMDKKETLNLVNNYYGIKSQQIRKQLFNLVKTMKVNQQN